MNHEINILMIGVHALIEGPKITATHGHELESLHEDVVDIMNWL